MSPHLDGRPHPMRSLLILGFAALAFSLAQTMLIPALGELTHQLGTDASGIAWVLTGYLLAAAVATPVAGRLGDMFGKRRLLVLSLVAFGLGSTVAALGSSLEVVVVGRVLQGFGGGIFPLCFGIIRDEFPREKVAGQHRPDLGDLRHRRRRGPDRRRPDRRPPLLPLDLLARHDHRRARRARHPALGARVARAHARAAWTCAARRCSGVGLVLPLIAISRANDWGWGSTRTLVLIAAGLAVLALWTVVERRTEQPLADIPTLMKPPVLMTNIATLLVGFGMFGSFLLIPQLAELPESTGFGFGLDATGAGLLLLPGVARHALRGPGLGRRWARASAPSSRSRRARRSTSAGLFGLGLRPRLGALGDRLGVRHVRRASGSRSRRWRT